MKSRDIGANGRLLQGVRMYLISVLHYWLIPANDRLFLSTSGR